MEFTLKKGDDTLVLSLDHYQAIHVMNQLWKQGFRPTRDAQPEPYVYIGPNPYMPVLPYKVEVYKPLV